MVNTSPSFHKRHESLSTTSATRQRESTSIFISTNVNPIMPHPNRVIQLCKKSVDNNEEARERGGNRIR